MTGPARIRLRLDKNQPGPHIPSALETYRALRADGGEAGKRIKSVLERRLNDPGKVRRDSLRYRPDGWLVPVEMADESTCWVIWRQPAPDLIDVLWIGPQPGSGSLAYSTERHIPDRRCSAARRPSDGTSTAVTDREHSS